MLILYLLIKKKKKKCSICFVMLANEFRKSRFLVSLGWFSEMGLPIGPFRRYFIFILCVIIYSCLCISQGEKVRIKSTLFCFLFICLNVIFVKQCLQSFCRCGYEFCYTCGAEWKNKKATCSCKIWDERNIIHDNWQR